MVTTPVRPEPMRFVLVAKLRSYLGLHEDAIGALTKGLEHHPGDAVLLRHRGEFLMTIRRYDEAIVDLEAAAAALERVPDAIDPYRSHLLPEIDRLLLGEAPRLVSDPLPVDAATVAAFEGTYVGTLASSTWYHLALTRYLQGDDRAADRAFRTTERVAVFADTHAAIANWRYLALRRAGEVEEAHGVLAAWSTGRATAEPSYARNLAMYRGDAPPTVPREGPARARVTQGYGAAAWLLAEGRTAEAVEAMRTVVGIGDATAFGHLAALEDLQRLGFD